MWYVNHSCIFNSLISRQFSHALTKFLWSHHDRQTIEWRLLVLNHKRFNQLILFTYFTFGTKIKSNPRVFYILGKYSTTELHSQSQVACIPRKTKGVRIWWRRRSERDRCSTCKYSRKKSKQSLTHTAVNLTRKKLELMTHNLLTGTKHILIYMYYI